MLGIPPLILVFLALAISFGVLSGLWTYQEIGEINRKLPEDQQISYLGAPLGKLARIKREYIRLYPKGRVDFWRVTFQTIAFGFIALLAITMLTSHLPL